MSPKSKEARLWTGKWIVQLIVVVIFGVVNSWVRAGTCLETKSEVKVRVGVEYCCGGDGGCCCEQELGKNLSKDDGVVGGECVCLPCVVSCFVGKVFVCGEDALVLDSTGKKALENREERLSSIRHRPPSPPPKVRT
ncbi:MAG: hypothetical protein N2035_05015 [Chthoniobacterales bacterium]|nr:hypothetical protein [Chthoniobacterales bacterium]